MATLESIALQILKNQEHPFWLRHSRQVAKTACKEKYRKILDLGKITRGEIYLAGLFHDLGKIHPEVMGVLIKNMGVKLEEDDADKLMINRHPLYGLAIIRDLEKEHGNINDSIKMPCLYHQIRYDKKGYPQEKDVQEFERLFPSSYTGYDRQGIPQERRLEFEDLFPEGIEGIPKFEDLPEELQNLVYLIELADTIHGISCKAILSEMEKSYNGPTNEKTPYDVLSEFYKMPGTQIHPALMEPILSLCHKKLHEAIMDVL